MAHVLIVVARRYNGHELWTTLGTLRHRGHSVEVISTSHLIADEVTGKTNTIKRLLDDVPNIDDFDAIMFVSGNMKDTEAYWHDKRTLSYVDQAVKRDMPVAAICCSVPTIRKAARGKRVSFFPLIRSGELLSHEGALLQTVSLSVDGHLVTAENQMVTQMWAEAFCDVLDGVDPNIHLIDSGFTPGKRMRKPDPDLQKLRDISRRTGRTGFKE